MCDIPYARKESTVALLSIDLSPTKTALKKASYGPVAMPVIRDSKSRYTSKLQYVQCSPDEIGYHVRQFA